MAGPRAVVISAMLSAKHIGVRKREGPPQDLPDTPLSHLLPKRSGGRVRELVERDSTKVFS